MSYVVRIARQAEAVLRRYDRRLQERLLRRLDQIAPDPFGSYTKPPTGPGGQRAARVGDHRTIFTIDPGARVVNVSAIGPRGQIYRGL